MKQANGCGQNEDFVGLRVISRPRFAAMRNSTRWDKMSKPKERTPSEEKSEPVTITMRPIYFQKAEEIMAKTGEKISELLRRLINEEYERREAAMALQEHPTPHRTAKPERRKPQNRAGN